MASQWPTLFLPAYLQLAQHSVPLRNGILRVPASVPQVLLLLLVLLLLAAAAAAGAWEGQDVCNDRAAAHEAGRQAVQASGVHTKWR